MSVFGGTHRLSGNILTAHATLHTHSLPKSSQELQYLDDHKGLHECLAGVGYVLGPVSRDHWFVYVADKV